MDARTELLLSHFKTPSTLQEAAEAMGISYATVYKYVKQAEKEGLLKQVPTFAKSHRYVVTTGATLPDGRIRVYTAAGKEMDLRELILSTQKMDKGVAYTWKIFGGLLAHLSIRAWRKSQGIEIHPEPITVKLMLNDVRDMLKRAIAIVDQVQYAPIWNDGEMDLVTSMGIEDPQEFLELAVWWEHLWQGRPQEEPADKETPDDDAPVDSDAPKLRPV